MGVAQASEKETRLRWIFPFGKDLRLPPLNRKLLGGKGKGLAEMASIGLPVPPGFIITADACNTYRSNRRQFPDGLEAEVHASMQLLEKQMDAQFGSAQNPLLVSVRSGAAISMPGMMDTVLNLGLNDQAVQGFAKAMNNKRLAYDSYRRFIAMYADIVHQANRQLFEDSLEALKERKGVTDDVDLDVDALQELCETYKDLYYKEVGENFPQDTKTQLFAAIRAVFQSWDSERATVYRQIHQISEDLGTAVTVQSMVFGNRNDHSATGVGFTRDPATGDNHFYGEFLRNAQGEEVVAGIRTPHPMNLYQKEITGSDLQSLEELMPDVYQQLEKIVKQLESHYQDMQDIEFTIDDGRLFMLQTRTGKRTGPAAVRMAMEMWQEELIDERTALHRVEPQQLVQLLAPVFNRKEKERAADKRVTKGLNAGPGAASGCVALTSRKALEYQKQGIPCILVRRETNPDDFPGMVASEGILTARGGSTSHAAVVARGMGKPCIVGCGELQINSKAGTISCNGATVKEGDRISIDGTTGEVFFCPLDTSPSEVVQVLITKELTAEQSPVFQNYHKLMQIADKYRTLHVRANADTGHDSTVARAFGAEGIGLCRTEHMFMEKEQLTHVRRMFFSDDTEDRNTATQKLLPYQKRDFKKLFQSAQGDPVTIRLLDPPLHEFLPSKDSELDQLAKELDVPLDTLKLKAQTLHEHNPMLGYRGCRLGVIHPELTRIQTRAMVEAAIEVEKEGGSVRLEIMIPLVSVTQELAHQKKLIQQTIDLVCQEYGYQFEVNIGTMIELPRAALVADRIAQDAEFFSFGTNDLTQTTLGISRDDSARFVPLYIQGVPTPGAEEERLQIMRRDPFVSIDQEGVGELMKTAISRGRRTRPDLKCGICGEHGGDPESVTFCHQIGIDYVSCSPYRVPVARLAAAHAALTERKN